MEKLILPLTHLANTWNINIWGAKVLYTFQITSLKMIICIDCSPTLFIKHEEKTETETRATIYFL